ncbi:MAG: phosphate ABC transporter substrate-binding protein PstS [Candidatus Latescibacterota bacterium]
MIRRLLLIAVLSATGSPAATVTDGILTGAGATFPLPLYERWFDLFGQETGVRAIYQAVGSGEGVQRLMGKWVDFAATDAYLTNEQMRLAPAAVVHLPTCVGAVVITYNLPGQPELRLTPEILAAVFLGQVTRWSDERLAAVCPGGSLPRQKITVVHRSEGSGTTFIFTDYLAKVSPAWQARVGRGTKVTWPAGIGVEGNPGVAQFVARIPGSIGYLELNFAVQQRLTAALLQNRHGEYIKPSPVSVSAAAEVELPPDTRILLTDTPVPGGYPISAFTYLVVYQEQAYDRRTRRHAAALARFLQWVLTTGQEHTTSLFYAPLPAQVRSQSLNLLSWLTYDGQPFLVP